MAASQEQVGQLELSCSIAMQLSSTANPPRCCGNGIWGIGMFDARVSPCRACGPHATCSIL